MKYFWYYFFKILVVINNFVSSKKNYYYLIQVVKTCKKVGEGLKVNGPSYVNKNTILGSNVNFNGMKIGGKGDVVIGDNFHSGVNCKIITQIHNYRGAAIPYDNTIILKTTKIGDNVWLGDDVIIIGGVSIGNGVIIQAGSVVVKDIPDYGIAGGHPAQVFKSRNIDHYLKLLNEKKFH